MHSFLKIYLHYIKNCIGLLIKNPISEISLYKKSFEINRDPCLGIKKIGRFDFLLLKGLQIDKRKKNKINGYIWPGLIWFKFVHYWGGRDHVSKGNHSKNEKGPEVHWYFSCRHYCISHLLHLASLSLASLCSLDPLMLAGFF